MTEHLKPCPFCGATADVECGIDYHYTTGKLMDYWEVQCSQVACFVFGPRRESKEQAVEAWNKRHLSEQDIQSVLDPTM